MNPTTRGFIRKELSQALRDPRMRGMLLFMPIIQLLIFGYALSSEIRNIRLAVYARPGDAFSRQLARRFYAGGWFIPVDAGTQDPVDMLRSGRAEVALIAPADGGDKAYGRGDAAYQLLIDATNAERARGVEQYARAILAEHLSDLHAPAGATFNFSTRLLYNPEDDTATYMVPGTLALMLFLVTITLTSMAMTRELEAGTIETLLAAPISPWEIFLGKTVPYALLGFCDLPLLMFVAWLMGVPIRAPLWEFALVAAVFVCTSVSIGFLLATFMRTAQQATMGTFLFLFPTIQLSGVIYPVENMPKAVIALTYLDPIRYLVVLIRHMMLKGGDPGAILPNLAALAAIGAASLFWAVRRFHQTLN